MCSKIKHFAEIQIDYINMHDLVNCAGDSL